MIMRNEQIEILKEKYSNIEQIVVDPEEVIEAVSYAEESDGSQMSQGSKVLRVTPPFEGCVEADVFFSEGGSHYPPEIKQPIHISPYAFINEDASTKQRMGYPDWLEIRRLAAKERDTSPEDVEEAAVEEDFEFALEEYHRQIRKRLADRISPDYRCGDAEQALAGIPIEYRNK